MDIRGKYFTPKIEELFVGYETEQIFYGEFTSSISLAYEREPHPYESEVISVPIKLLKKEINELLKYNLDVSHSIRDKEGKSIGGTYRTPYLKKEQLENEGWKHFENNCFKLNGRWSCYWYEDELRIKIIDIENDKEFRGNIKCINQFRNILKYLLINP